MSNEDLESRKKEVIEFVKRNPKTTYRDIRKNLRTHIEKLFRGGMAEIFRDAGVEPPRTFKTKTKEEKKKIIVDYIRKHPTAGGHTIRKDTKINFSTIFTNIKEAYKEAGVKYPREGYPRQRDNRLREKKKREIIKLLKENPSITVMEITRKTNCQPYLLFKNMKEIYQKAGIKEIKNHEKRTLKIREKIIYFIKKNPLATQREINKACKTHVQELFEKGIFEAYEKAGIEFPYERLKLYGAVLKEIRNRANSFEDKIALMLTGYGKVNRLVKTKRGIADIILERKDKKAVIEIKDYEAKDISISQVRQLNKYLEDCNYNLGILICKKKPAKDKFLIGKNKIFILENEELYRIPEIVG